MSQVRGLAEVVLFVQDVERSLGFYRDVLGLTVISPPRLPARFLRLGDAGEGVPQQIVLVPRPEGAAPLPADRAQRGLHHIGIELAPGSIESERGRLEGLGYAVRAGAHPFLPVEAIYIDDPDGNEVELVVRIRE